MNFHFDTAFTNEGWQNDVQVTVVDGCIAAVSADMICDPASERHAIAIPGLPNLHSHAFQRAMSGFAEMRGPGTDSFWSWREAMYRFALAMSPDDVEAVAALAYAEMLEGGFTRVGEFHYLHHDKDGSQFANVAELASRVAAASAETGLQLTLLPVFYAHSGFGSQPPGEAQRRFVSSVDSFGSLYFGCEAIVRNVEGSNLGIAPHSLRAASPEELLRILSLAKHGPIHIHIAEQLKEVADCVSWSGLRPVEWLMSNMPVDEKWCLVHATHMTGAETEAAAKSGAAAGLCPVTEANLGDGIFDGVNFESYGGRFGIGTDSNVAIGAAAELRQLEYSQRLSLRSRNVLAKPMQSTGAAIFGAALFGGSAALGQTQFGLSAGASADFVTLHATHAALAGHRNDSFFDAMIFGNSTNLIDTVWTRGKKRVGNGRHVDAGRIGARYAETMRRLLAV